MIIDRRQLHFETVPMQPHASVSVREFKEECFPFRWHCHPEVELAYIVQGSGFRFVSNSIRSFEAGDLCLFGAYLPHSWQSSSDRGPVHSIIAQFNQEQWGPFLKLPEMRRVDQLLKDAASRGIQVVGSTSKVVASLIRQLADEKVGSIGHLQILIEVLGQISNCPDDRIAIGSEMVSPSREDPDATAVNRALLVLNESRGDVLPSQAEIAEQLAMTPSSFSRAFRRYVGKTYRDYLNEWRVNLACRALLENNDAILDISLTAGFENVSNFHRRFREHTGMTPAQWRQEARKVHGSIDGLTYPREKAG